LAIDEKLVAVTISDSVPNSFYRGHMKKTLFTLIAFAVFAISTGLLAAQDHQKTLVITMTNNPDSNAIIVVDAKTNQRLQTISTGGKGGVSQNAGGVKQYDGKLLAAVNYLSGTVAIFTREDNELSFDELVVPSSPPVSVDFSKDHLYVAGDTTVDSFEIHGNHVGRLDGTTHLALAGGGILSPGFTSQIGVVNSDSLIVAIKTDPIPGTVDVIQLKDGAVFGDADPVSAPDGTLAPFGFSVYPDGTALITLAHSGHDGLFRNGAFQTTAVSGGQAGNCWTTRVGKYVFVVNTGSRTISRVVSTGNNIFVDAAVAANVIAGGSPTDTDAAGGYLAVIDHTSGANAESHLSLFTYNRFGELSISGSIVSLNAPTANGMAIMVPGHDDSRR
jgi:hypothetical protein